MNTGWEVRPLGWVLLALLIGMMVYYAVKAHVPLKTITRHSKLFFSPYGAPSFALVCAVLHICFRANSLVMNEYGFFTHEDGSYQERVHPIQRAYASYAALLAISNS